MRKGAAPSHDRRVKSDRVCAVIYRRKSALAKISRCPLKDRQPHSAKIPGKLTDAAVRHIEQQLTTKGSRALPYLGLANHFYRCRDCYAVRTPETYVAMFRSPGARFQPHSSRCPLGFRNYRTLRTHLNKGRFLGRADDSYRGSKNR